VTSLCKPRPHKPRTLSNDGGTYSSRSASCKERNTTGSFHCCIYQYQKSQHANTRTLFPGNMLLRTNCVIPVDLPCEVLRSYWSELSMMVLSFDKPCSLCFDRAPRRRREFKAGPVPLFWPCCVPLLPHLDHNPSIYVLEGTGRLLADEYAEVSRHGSGS
jgi:hypothetical protein